MYPAVNGQRLLSELLCCLVCMVSFCGRDLTKGRPLIFLWLAAIFQHLSVPGMQDDGGCPLEISYAPVMKTVIFGIFSVMGSFGPAVLR